MRPVHGALGVGIVGAFILFFLFAGSEKPQEGPDAPTDRDLVQGEWVGKEVGAGLLNGLVVAATTALVVYIWMSSAGLAAVIGVAMVFSMVLAGLSGAVIPMVLQSLGQDPAQSSSIVLTTVTDVVGFLSFLGLATLFSAFLVAG